MPGILKPSLEALPKAPGSEVNFGAVLYGVDVENMTGKSGSQYKNMV